MLIENWNPETPDAEATIGFLNTCFGGGWDNNLYQWYLARYFNGWAPDRLVIRDGDAILAGSVVNYRQLRMTDGAIRDIGIASGSWTLPKARGKGLFTRMMQASTERAAENGCHYFLAFVTEDNASRNALERCGATMIPAAYFVSSDDVVDSDRLDFFSVECASASRDELFTARKKNARTSFYYDSSESWAEQHLNRPFPVEVLRVGRHYALIEQTPETDRLQWSSADVIDRLDVASALACRAAANDRKFFMYGTGPLARADASGHGLAARPGFIACLATAAAEAVTSEELAAKWDIQSGDRL